MKGIGPNNLGSPAKQTTKAKAIQGKSVPTRRDSVVSAYHHNHMFHKNKYYMNDPIYDKSKKDAKEVAKKFPKLDAHMKVKENRAKLGYDYK